MINTIVIHRTFNFVLFDFPQLLTAMLCVWNENLSITRCLQITKECQTNIRGSFKCASREEVASKIAREKRTVN